MKRNEIERKKQNHAKQTSTQSWLAKIISIFCVLLTRVFNTFLMQRKNTIKRDETKSIQQLIHCVGHLARVYQRKMRACAYTSLSTNATYCDSLLRIQNFNSKTFWICAGGCSVKHFFFPKNRASNNKNKRKNYFLLVTALVKL